MRKRRTIGLLVTVMDNSSFGYQLPYKTRPLVEINDATTYGLHCLYQVIVLPLITFGSVGYDSFFITLSLHVIAQLSVLKYRVRLALEDPNGCRCGIKKLINKHYQLIGYIILSTLFAYCYTGECLIQESTDFAVAFYEYEWYDVSPMDLKMVLICMIGASKPLQLTSGKFFVLSLCTFSDVRISPIA
ncbi:uncharacterized protein LOC122635833 [Vespula pensylvanica]|uniref:uncharacterized protein LOC122635833 n=1 Tax=Vespula pensylvanica TaxID=30213 RepID=UPI001CBA32E7|nr:uncharacterized protein LOC122635833 [Vespula pensylvanica]